MSDYDRDWMDAAQDQFEDFWLDVCCYANEIGYDVSYVEDEFILDGEFIEVPLPPAAPPSNDKEFRYNPRPGIM